MKKYLIFLLTIMYIMVSVVIIKNYNINMIENLLGINNGMSIVYVESVDKVNSDEIMGHIRRCTQKKELNIYYINYDALLPHQTQQISIYVDNLAFLQNNITLKKGRYLKENDFNEYLSSVKSDDVNQVGIIKYPNKHTKVYIRPIKYHIEKTYGKILNMFYVDTSDTSVLKELKSGLENQYHMQVKISEELKQSYYFNRFEATYVLSILYILLFILLVYTIFDRYKELAVYKMFGMNNSDISRVILMDIIKTNIKTMILTYILVFLYLIFFNGLTGIGTFTIIWMQTIIWIFALNIVLSIIPIIILMRFVSIPLMLKNKKPLQIPLYMNYILKAISLIILVNLILSTYMNTIELLNSHKELVSWEQSKQYAKVNIVNQWKIDGQNTIDYGDEFAYKFFRLTNEKGGILINTSTYFYPDEYKYFEGKPPYSPEHSIDVNNNYLKINPIYDVDGNLVNIPDHDDYIVNLLVPNKFKRYNEEIKDMYTKDFINGRNPDINIIYVMDNQKYFRFSIDYKTFKRSSYITDPIVNVISYKNAFSGDWYFGCVLTHSYYVKVNTDGSIPIDLTSDLKISGLDNYISGITTVYAIVSNHLKSIMTHLINSIVKLLLALLTVSTLIIFITLNYLEKNKVDNMILKLHGFNTLYRHNIYYLTLINIWFISLSLSEIISFLPLYISNFQEIPINLESKLIIVLTLILVDVILSGLLIKIYENKKISSVLKGE